MTFDEVLSQVQALLLKTGGQKVAEAEECFRLALDVARRQEQSPWNCRPP